ncbi:MAG: type VI secretion system tube protein Hcp [Candidatus Nitrosotenuis sp.]
MRYFLLFITILAISSFTIYDADAAIFLKIDTIPGDSTAQGHRNEIELNSLQFGVARPIGSPVGSGLPRDSIPTASEVLVTKMMDVSSTKLFAESLGGKSHDKIEIFLAKTEADKLVTFAQYTLEDVLITGYSVSSGGDTPAESISLNYLKITTKFIPTGPDGKPGTPLLFCFDFAQNKECTPSTPPQTDSDGDGVPDTSDNCPNVSNATQTNTDGDASGDTCDADDDNDGIADDVDFNPLVSSNDFADNDPEPITAGTINRGDQSITVTDVTDPEGVRIMAALGGGTSPATVSVCSNTAVISLDAGEEALLTCSSVGVVAVTGSIDVTFTADDGTTGTATLDAGESVTFEPQTFTVTNNGDTDVIITVNGNPISIPSGGSIDIDTQPPTITAPADVTTEATGPLTTVSLGTATATDNEDPSPTITNDAPASFPVGTTTVTWTATDVSGNSASDTQDVTVADTTPPTIDQHADITILTNNPAGIAVSYDSPATRDLVDGDGIAACSPPSGTVFIPGHTAVTCSTTDSRGNQAIDSFFDVFVDLDAIPPEAYNQFDPATKNVLVFGTDDRPGMTTTPIPPTSVTQAKWNAEDDEDREDHGTNAELRTYEITDAAGNKMTLKEIVKLKGKEIKVKVLSIQYGDSTPIKPDKNKKAFEWSLNKDGTIKELEQKMTAKDGKSKQEAKAKYSSKKDQTKIESEKPKIKLTKQGLALLQIHTANGKLVIKY